MLKGALTLASLGLAFNVILWSVPGMVAASALPHALFPEAMPALSQALASAEGRTGATVSLPDALLQLIGAESEALEVANAALQPGTPPADLSARANAAGARVLDAAYVYVHSAQAVLNH
jgi:hypothetical protein